MKERLASCYPIPNKPKARRTCEAFAQGVRAAAGYEKAAAIHDNVPAKLDDGMAVFYGVRPCVSHLFRECKVSGRDFAYIDNSYLDATREARFRVTKNALQHDGSGTSTGDRFRALGLSVAPWRRSGRGRNVLVCLQSPEFMACVADDPDWSRWVVTAIREQTDRPIVLRAKGSAIPLADALRDAWVVVTWSSAAAVQALLAGVPVCVTPTSAAHRFTTPLDEIDRPRMVDGREEWAAVLADNEWTLDDFRSGECWRALKP